MEQYDSTTVVPPGLAAEIDRFGNIVIDCTTVAHVDRTGLATPVNDSIYAELLPLEKRARGLA